MVVAFDHALVLGPISGTENPADQIRRFTDAGVDAVLLNLGLIQVCLDSLLGPSMPGIIARIDWTTLWGAPGGEGSGDLRSCLLARPEDAMHHGADAVLTYLAVGTGDSDFEMKEVARNAEVARECERIGIPLIIETLARGKNVKDPSDPNWLKLHTRMAAELGADLVKTDYAGDPQSMRGVVEIVLFRFSSLVAAGTPQIPKRSRWSTAWQRLVPRGCSSVEMCFRRTTCLRCCKTLARLSMKANHLLQRDEKELHPVRTRID